MLLLRDEKRRAEGAERLRRHIRVVDDVMAGRADLRALQSAKLAATLEAAARSELYGGMLPDGRVDPRAALASLPLLSKAQLSEKGSAAFTRRISEFLHYYESSGTTGDPVAAPKALDDLLVNTANIGELWGRVLDPDDVALVLINAPFAPAPYQFEKVLEYVGVMSLRPWVDNITGDYTRVLRLIGELSVNVFVGPPSRLLELAQFALRHGQPVPRFDHLLLMAEQTGPSFLRHLERLTGGRAYVGCYGASETGTIAVTCEHGRLHLQLQSFLLELLDEDGIRVLDGRRDHGELVVTTLDLLARPLLRYRTGDLVEIDDEPCPCGLAVAVLRTLGRAQDALVLPGGAVRQDEFEAMLWPSDPASPVVLNYMLVVRGAEIIALVTTDRTTDDGWADATADRLAPLFPDRRLAVRAVEVLPPLASLGGYLGWKLSRVLDLGDERMWDRLPAPIAAVVRESVDQFEAAMA